MAWAIRDAGNTVVSEASFRQVWKLREKVLGPDDPETLEALNGLASTIERAGRLTEAEAMFRKLYER